MTSSSETSIFFQFVLALTVLACLGGAFRKKMSQLMTGLLRIHWTFLYFLDTLGI